MNKFKAIALFLLMAWSVSFLLIGLSYCCEVVAATNEEGKEQVDNHRKQRIIALGGDITEIMYALNAEQQLVGVDTTSRWPEAAQQLPQVGYFRALSAEGILSLSPDLLIMSDAAGPPSVIEQIQKTGVATIKVSTGKTPKGVIDKIRRVAEVLYLPERGEQLVGAIQADINQFEKLKLQWKQQPRVAFLFSVSKGAAMASGRETAADAMIKMAGGINVFANYTGYKSVNDEAFVVADPEFILLTEHTLTMMGGLNKIMDLPGVSLTTAVKKQQIIVMDTLYLLGFGPRTGQALLDLGKQLHSVVDDNSEHE